MDLIIAAGIIVLLLAFLAFLEIVLDRVRDRVRDRDVARVREFLEIDFRK